MRYVCLTLSLALSFTLLAGCGSEETEAEEKYERPAQLGKADGPDSEGCDGAALDANGVCRLPNGRFAPALCCATTNVCENATIDAQGQCRDQETGRFVPKACCDELCEGAKIINRYCRYEDTGRFALAACCADQCFDLQLPVPDDVPPGSCEESCGQQSLSGDCWCDAECIGFGDCCTDFADACPDIADPPPPEHLSCAGACGSHSVNQHCWCDELCYEFGDCCADKVAHCGGLGNDTIVACEVDDECANTAVDEAGICRNTITGQFALAACCAPTCPNPNLYVEDDAWVCRNEVTQDVLPLLCCYERCIDAELDRHGICRNIITGQFADPACCADLCWAAQTAGADEDLDACNGEQEVPEE